MTGKMYRKSKKTMEDIIMFEKIRGIIAGQLNIEESKRLGQAPLKPITIR